MIDIYTLGEFVIRENDVSMVDKIGSQNRLFLLLKYLLIHEGKRLTPNTIIEDLLKNNGLYHEIIDACEKSVQIKPYEEFINKYFMEALLEVGQKRFALSHYEYYTTKLYNDLRAVPSSEIKEVYKALQNHEEKLKGIIDLSIIDKELELDRYSKGALICELHYFKFLYNWELRNKNRINKENLFLGIITLDNIGYTPLSAQDIKDEMRALIVIVYKGLRKTDVLSKWNDSQLVMLLYNIEEIPDPDPTPTPTPETPVEEQVDAVEIDEEIPEGTVEVQEEILEEEIPEEVIIEEELPQGQAAMPKTGSTPTFIYYGIGALLVALGIGTGRKRKNK